MPSVYKSLGRQAPQDVFDSDEQDLSDSETDQSSGTVQAALDHHKTPHTMSSLATEIKNRVLMLTTRGVSHRYAALSVHPLPAYPS
jgi:hypothetical protein